MKIIHKIHRIEEHSLCLIFICRAPGYSAVCRPQYVCGSINSNDHGSTLIESFDIAELPRLKTFDNVPGPGLSTIDTSADGALTPAYPHNLIVDGAQATEA